MKKLTSLILTVCILSTLFAPFSVLPVGAGTAGGVVATSEGDYVYYSDLFYGYSWALYNDYLYNYYSETGGPNGILTQVEDDYRNSSMFLWTDIKASLAAATDLKEWTKIIADWTGLTKFTYNDALDKANEAFAQEIYGTPALAKYYGNNAKWMKNFNKVLKVFDAFEQNFEVYELTEEEIYVEMLKIVKNQNTFTHIGVSQIQVFEQKLLTDIHGVTKLLSKGADAMTAAKTVVIGLMMEDFRLEILDDILASCEKGTTLYDGMTRLKNQLRNGFATYFWDNYITTEFMDKIADEILEYFTADTLLGSGSYKVITAIINLGSWVVFDVLFNVPDIDDLTTQMVLSDYSRNLYSAILIQSDVFEKQFKTTEVKKFETLFTAYIAATSAALKASDKIKLSGNKAMLSEITTKYTEVDVYEVYIETAKAKVSSGNTPRIDLGNRYLDGVSLHSGSDIIEDGYLYCAKGVFEGDITIGSCTVPAGSVVTVKGKIHGNNRKSHLINNGVLHVTGDVTDTNITNNGDLNIDGDVKSSYVPDWAIIGYQSAQSIRQTEESAVLRLGGNFSRYSSDACQITAGTVIFDGNEQQTVSKLRAKNIEVTNPAGIKYLSSIHLYGEYKLNHNPLDNNGCSTYIYDGASFADDSDYKKLLVYYDMTLSTNVKGDISITRDNSYGSKATLTIPEGKEITITGNLSGSLSSTSLNIKGVLHLIGNVNDLSIVNDGILDVNGNMMFSQRGFTQNKNESSVLYLDGNASWGTSGCNISVGTVIFDGTEQQTVKNLRAKDIEVTNPAGIKYLSNIHLYGEYKLNHNPLDNNGYSTRVYNGASFADDSDYKKILVENNMNLTTSVKGDIYIVCKDYSYGSRTILTIPEGGSITIIGNLSSGYRGSLVNEGTLHINGNLDEIGITNDGVLDVNGNVTFSSKYFYQEKNENSILYLTGNASFEKNCCSITAGTVVFNGSQQQTVKGLSAPTIVLENPSDEGVVFTSSISSSVLFDHQGNNFTLYNNGSGSKFVDYDGDGLKDHVDPKPTVGNPCTLYFKSVDAEKGTVSVEKIETIGGTKVIVTATPTFKYEFSKWLNSSGKSVSTSAEGAFVAAGDETYTAVFVKRKQPITTQTEGGKIVVSSSAEIESEVSVSVKENDGYIFVESSLAYNGNPILNGSFIMPDEAVVITAEFVRNEAYFALAEKLSEAKTYKYNSYSSESLGNLQNAIKTATATLDNHISLEESEKQVELLQEAIDSLRAKYIVAIEIVSLPQFLVGINSASQIKIKVFYDNSTTATPTDFLVSGYDYAQLGEQTIAIEYSDYKVETEITVLLRNLSDCTVEPIGNQIYDSEDFTATPKPIVSYSLTGEVLAEGVDYILSYEDNDTFGTATAIITGIGNYGGVKKESFLILSPSELIPDDLDGDGEVSVSDLTLMAKYIAGWDVSIDESNTDCDKDGSISVSDLTFFAKYIAGWNIVLG